MTEADRNLYICYELDLLYTSPLPFTRCSQLRYIASKDKWSVKIWAFILQQLLNELHVLFERDL